MNKRLFWNFEINTNGGLQIPTVGSGEDLSKKWESRFFWPDGHIIILHGLDDPFLWLSRYQIKHREDAYYLLPNLECNLKVRHDELFYKPMLTKSEHAIAYGKKIKLEKQKSSMPLPGCPEENVITLLDRLNKEGRKILVEKESIIYKFSTTPVTKLELARIMVAQKNYYSASIESRSRHLVESITKQMIGDLPTSDYITFLKKCLT